MRNRAGVATTFERKSMPMVAWYMLSKESYMKRVIREVLPTVGFGISCWCVQPEGLDHQDIPLCSPKNTSLNEAIVSHC